MGKQTVGSQVKTWNNSFNEAAAACGMTAEKLRDLKAPITIKDWMWQRFGDRISCARAPAIWTVDLADLGVPTYEAVCGKGSVEPETRIVEADFFCHANSYPENALERIEALAIGEIADLTGPSGVHTVQRIS